MSRCVVLFGLVHLERSLDLIWSSITAHNLHCRTKTQPWSLCGCLRWMEEAQTFLELEQVRLRSVRQERTPAASQCEKAGQTWENLLENRHCSSPSFLHDRGTGWTSLWVKGTWQHLTLWSNERGQNSTAHHLANTITTVKVPRATAGPLSEALNPHVYKWDKCTSLWIKVSAKCCKCEWEAWCWLQILIFTASQQKEVGDGWRNNESRWVNLLQSTRRLRHVTFHHHNDLNSSNPHQTGFRASLGITDFTSIRRLWRDLKTADHRRVHEAVSL